MAGIIDDLHLRRREGKIITKKMPFSQEVKKSISMLIFTLLTIIVLLSITFLLNTSQSTQKGYILKQEQIDQENYLLQNRDLINKIIQIQAYKYLEDNPIIKQMVPPSTIDFIEQQKHSVTTKKTAVPKPPKTTATP